MVEYVFQNDFFSHGEKNFSDFLYSLKNQPVNFLEIGSFEGRSAVWVLENVLLHKDSTLDCIEPNILDIFLNNIKDFKNVTIHQQRSGYALSKFILDKRKFDFIYIDAVHSQHYPLQDLVMCYPILKCGGILALDDYVWSYIIPNTDEKIIGSVDKCVHNFLSIYASYFQVLRFDYCGVGGNQVWLKKIIEKEC